MKSAKSSDWLRAEAARTGILTSAIGAGSLAVSGGLTESIFVPVTFAAFGIGAFVTNLVRLPRWAQQREQQMEHVAKNVAAIVRDEE